MVILNVIPLGASSIVKAISPAQLFDLLVDTLSQCATSFGTMSDDEMAYRLFEQFDIGAHSFLHDDSLSVLSKADLISGELVNACRMIRTNWLDLNRQEWTIQEI